MALTGAAFARYIPTGHLVYVGAGVLYAVRFDPERLVVSGMPTIVRFLCEERELSPSAWPRQSIARVAFRLLGLER